MAYSDDLDDVSDSKAKGRGPNRPTPDLTKAFAKLVEEGSPFNVVCDYLGIPQSTFYNWQRKGRFYNQSPEAEPKFKAYGDFEAAIRKAGAAYYLELVRRLHDPKNARWNREMSILERRDRANFAKFDVLGAAAEAETLDPDERYA